MTTSRSWLVCGTGRIELEGIVMSMESFLNTYRGMRGNTRVGPYSASYGHVVMGIGTEHST